MRLVSLLVLVFVLIVGGWTALWFYASGEAGRSLDGWIAQQAKVGQTWTCPNRQTGGYPFAITIACDRPAFSGRALDDEAKGSLAGLRVTVDLTDWHRVHLDLTGPFAFRSADGQTDLQATWSALALALGGLPDSVTSTVLDGADLTIKGRAGGTDLDTLQAAKANITTTAAGADQSLDFTATFASAGVPALDALVGDRQPTTIDTAGHLTRAVLTRADTLADMLEQWRAANGSIAFSTLRLSRGPSELALSGPLAIDPQHRLTGRLDARFIGLGPILKRYGINPNLATAGSILNSLFGGNRGGQKPPSDPNTLQLPMTLRDGHLEIGPIVTPVALTPLY